MYEYVCFMYYIFRMENNEGKDILFTSRHFPLVVNFYLYIYIYLNPSNASTGSLEYNIVARPSLVGDIHTHERARFELGKIEY